MGEEYSNVILETSEDRYHATYNQFNIINIGYLQTEWKRTKEKFNNIGVIWDELEYFLSEDEDFKITNRENRSLYIKVLNNQAFHNAFIMSKIIGRILPYNCKLELQVKEIKGEKAQDDVLVYYFRIETESENFYKGDIYIRKNSD